MCRTRKPCTRSDAQTGRTSHIPAISICAIATAVLMALRRYAFAQAGLDTGEGPVRAWGYNTSGNYFDVLGIQPYLGRFFHASDEHGPDSAPYIVLTYAGWSSRFHGDRGVVGRKVQLDKRPFTVIGVAPPGFRGLLVAFSPDLFRADGHGRAGSPQGARKPLDRRRCRPPEGRCDAHRPPPI